MRRRALLAAIGLGSITTVGALSVYEPPVLREVTIRNRTAETQTVAVRITGDGDEILNETYELASGEHRQLSCERTATLRTIQVNARLEDDAEWVGRTISSGGDHCRWIEVTDDGHAADTEGEDTVAVSLIGPCPPAEADPDRTACDVPRWTRPFRLL